LPKTRKEETKKKEHEILSTVRGEKKKRPRTWGCAGKGHPGGGGEDITTICLAGEGRRN